MKAVLVIHNVRSALNVGSLLRTAEGLGINEVYITGYSPYPEDKKDDRLPHHRQRMALQIHKTALGAEFFIKWHYEPNISLCLEKLKQSGYLITALEQTPNSVALSDFHPNQNVALVVGNEVSGIENSVLKQVDQIIHIPMRGHKESFNVAIAAAMALYHLKNQAAARQK
jgi:tRNA G18 (ribose-2'-O)-methylase SpoU